MSLYPLTPAYDSGFFDAGDGHRLYYERHGNPDGEKAVYLHGGPGGGCSFTEQGLFDPDHFDVLIFDQRGAGKSKPYAEISNNSIDKLVDDLESLRLHFNIENWSVCGGSWGSAYAMLYACKYAASVKRLLLRGICFADQDGANYINEENGIAATKSNSFFKDYLNFIAPENRTLGLAGPYYQKLVGDNMNIALEAAKRFVIWDTSISAYEKPERELEKIEADPHSVLALARIWFHFCQHEFTNENRSYLLDGMSKLNIPVEIIHGRQDYLCPVQNAIDLDAICKNSRLQIFDKCGHVQKELALTQAFIKITNHWRDQDRATS